MNAAFFPSGDIVSGTRRAPRPSAATAARVGGRRIARPRRRSVMRRPAIVTSIVRPSAEKRACVRAARSESAAAPNAVRIAATRRGSSNGFVRVARAGSTSTRSAPVGVRDAIPEAIVGEPGGLEQRNRTRAELVLYGMNRSARA